MSTVPNTPRHLPRRSLSLERRMEEHIMDTVMAASDLTLSYVKFKSANLNFPLRTAYYMPNDENEKERLDMMHELMLTMMGRKLFLSPIGSSPHRVLDLGTGTGMWAMEFGRLMDDMALDRY